MWPLRFSKKRGSGNDFVIVDCRHLRLRVHERAAGWTLARGTSAYAAMAVCIKPMKWTRTCRWFYPVVRYKWHGLARANRYG